jgi:glycogen(starch) synthase
MQVVQLGPYPPPYGGVQANLVAIREHLRRKGIESGVVNLTRHRREPRDGVFFPRTALETASLLLRLQARILHLHIGGSVSGRLAALGLFCGLLPGRRTVLTFHSGGYPSSEEGRKANPGSFRGFAFRHFDRIIVVNDQLANVFHRYGVKPERIRLIPPYSIDRNEMASSLAEPLGSFYRTHDKVLLSVGQLEPEYDLGLQIDILERVRQHFPRAGLVIIGSGSLEQKLRERMASKLYREHILLTGDVAHAQALRAIQDADILLRTTIYDGDSVSVREALLLGTPVIATDNGMRPAGPRLIPLRNADALYAAIAEILGRKREGTAQSELSGRENLEAVFELYRELAPIGPDR